MALAYVRWPCILEFEDDWDPEKFVFRVGIASLQYLYLDSDSDCVVILIKVRRPYITPVRLQLTNTVKLTFDHEYALAIHSFFILWVHEVSFIV